jgi:hypothetical protein
MWTDYSTFVPRGVLTFIEFVAAGAYCYFSANYLSGKYSNNKTHAYRLRVKVMSAFVALWWVVQFIQFATGSKSGRIGDSLYEYPIIIARSYGSQTIWAWYLAVLIFRPKEKAKLDKG